MASPVAYRRILPLANLIVFAILITIGYAGTSARTADSQALEIAHSAQTEGWQPAYLERPTPLTHLFAWSLNFPAMLFATPFGLLVKGSRGEWLVNSIGALYLLILWYLVGLWLDRRRDPSRRIRTSPALQVIRWTVLVASAGAFLLVIALVVARIALHELPETVCTLPMLVWPIFLAYAAGWEIARARNFERTRSATA